MSRSTEERDSTKSRGRPEGLPKRWSAQRKAEVVLRLLRGEDIGEVSREIRVAPPELERSRQQGANNSFETVATEWLTKHSPNWSTGWVRRLERELEREAFPYIGASPVADITAPDLLAVVRPVEARGHLRKAHTFRWPVVADVPSQRDAGSRHASVVRVCGCGP